MTPPTCQRVDKEVAPPEDVQSKSSDEEDPYGPPDEVAPDLNFGVVLGPHDLELQVGYFIGDHHLGDAANMFLYCAQVDISAKEAVKPSDQRVGIERATDKANDATMRMA
ncbi:Glutamine synthetase [Hordeum vulgare]|nr:Glutamine synthetase [Hordeum vulgare]